MSMRLLVFLLGLTQYVASTSYTAYMSCKQECHYSLTKHVAIDLSMQGTAECQPPMQSHIQI